jgi:hypothetical protein
MTEAIRVVGELSTKVRELLGGQNPTEARLATLLEELEARRQIGDLEAQRKLAEFRAEREPAPAPDERDEPDDDEEGEPPEPPAAPAEAVDPHDARMLAMIEGQSKVIAMMEQTIRELRAPKEALAADQAIGAGKLPVVQVEAPPLGLTGPADFPVGTWFKSPLGPPVPIKICGCGVCQPYRLHHYYCAQCRRGPLAYMGQQGPKGRKGYTAPGGVWGLNHEFCTTVCYQRYLESIGVVAGVNDHEPIGLPSDVDVPDLHALPIGSD